MYHSINISGKNTWTEWRLIPSSRPLVEMPSPKTEYADLPGRATPVDLSEVLTGHLLYGTRTGEWNFYATNDYTAYDWVKLRNALASYIHGKYHRVILEDEPDWYYEGRLTFDWDTEENWSMVTIGYDLGPFKHQVNIPAAYQNIKVSNSANLTVTGYDEYAVPTFVVNSTDGSGLHVGFGDEYYHLSDGEVIEPRIEFGPGSNKLTFYGNGTVSVNYRGGRL